MNYRIATDIWSTASLSSITNSSNTASGYDRDNVLSGPLETVWRTTADTGRFIDGDLGQTRSCNMVSVLGHNLRTDQTLTIRLRMGITSNFSTNLVDVTLDEDDIVGADVDNGPYPAVINWWFSSQNCRYWRLNIDQASNDDNYIEMGRVIVANYFTPTVNMDFGYRLSILDASRLARTHGNNLRIDRRAKTRESIATLSHLSVTEEIALNKAFTKHEVFVSAYPEETTNTELEQQHTILGLLGANTTAVRGHATDRQCQIRVKDISTLSMS